MIECPECNQKLSKAARICTSCGGPMPLRVVDKVLLGFLGSGILFLVVLAILKICASR